MHQKRNVDRKSLVVLNLKTNKMINIKPNLICDLCLKLAFYNMNKTAYGISKILLYPNSWKKLGKKRFILQSKLWLTLKFKLKWQWLETFLEFLQKIHVNSLLRTITICCFILRPFSENSAKIKRKFSIDRFEIFRRFFWKSVDNIPNICWVCTKTFATKNSGSQLYQN